MRNISKKQSGQVLVLILLVMLIGLTVGLSITSRTLQDLRSTGVTDESSRAFTAAEAGIEEALRSGAADSGLQPQQLKDSSNNKVISTYEFTAVEAGGGTEPFIFPDKIERDDTQQIWLIKHDPSGALIESPYYTSQTIDVCWGDDSSVIDDSTPAVEISVIYFDSVSGTYKIDKGAYDPYLTRRNSNGFADITAISSCGVDNSGVFRKTFTLPSGSVVVEALRLRLLYNPTAVTLAVKPVNASLPPQGKVISSTGKTTGGVTRKVEVFRSYPSMPAIFDYVLFSGNSSLPLQK